MTRTSDGASDPVTQQVRGVDLRARAPQSAIPTQGGPPLPPPRPGPPPMGPRVLGPPSGPAMRSPLVTPQGRPTPQHPSGEQTPLQDDQSAPLQARLATWWRRAIEAAKTPAGRWSLVGAVAVLQVFLLFSTVMWWMGGSSTAVAESKLAPMTWTGIVYDVGAAGVNLRSATTVAPESAKDTAARGSRLAISCGQTGDVVQKGTVHTATWLKTTDGLFVSMLYVRVPDRQSIPSCADSTVDAPLLALADPANPDLPPPPVVGSASSDQTSAQERSSSGSLGQPRIAAAPAQPGVAVPPGRAPAPAPAPAAVGPVGEGRASSPPPAATTEPTRGSTTTTAPPPRDDPDTTPVG